MVKVLAKFVVVAFRLCEDHSIFYRKCRSSDEVAEAIKLALTKYDADIISIRKGKGWKITRGG